MKEILSTLIVLIVACIFLWRIAPYIVVIIIVGVIVAIVFFVNKSKEKPQNYNSNKADEELRPLSFHLGENEQRSSTGENIYTKVVGVTFDGIQNILPRLHAGMPLKLVREPNNQYDKNAVAVWCNGQKIGHLSRDLAADIAPLIDSGTAVGGTIEGITGGSGKTYGCNIKVTIYK